MTIGGWRRTLAAAGGALLLGGGVVGAGSAQASVLPPHGELVYVANVNETDDPVTAYAAGSSGSVARAFALDDPKVSNTIWDPWGVTFDTTGHLYVQSFLSDADTFVFPPGARGTTAPSRIFAGAGQGPDNASIAVDANGFEYILGTQSGSSLAVYAPGASGTAGSSWIVSPLRTLTLDGNFNPWPQQLTTDGRNEALAAAERFAPVTFAPDNAIEVFGGGASGGASPVRVVSGADTGLNCAPCKISITFSKLTGRIYAAVSDLSGATTRILVFAAGAVGDARPLQTIEGSATGLSGMAVTGIAVSQIDGTIYAMVKPASTVNSPLLSTGRIDAFSRFANGNAAPVRSFTDAATGFADAAGIAVTSY
jgi:hypothetical protein